MTNPADVCWLMGFTSVSPTVFTFFYQHEPELALACAMLQNEEIARVVAARPDRFIGLGTLPMQAPNQAADELRHAVTVLGMRGAQIGSNIAGRNLDDPEFEPVWAAAAELDAFILVHPNNVAGADRLSSYYLTNLIGNPLDTTIAGACLDIEEAQGTALELLALEIVDDAENR